MRRPDSGSITPFVLIAVLAILPLAGLVIDGGRQLNGRARAISYAQESARAGAQALDLTLEQTRLVPATARQIAQEFCDQAREIDRTLVRCTPILVDDEDESGDFLTIGVETTVEIDPLLLDIVGMGPLRSDGRAVARAFTGITEADGGAVPTLPPPTLNPGEAGDGGLPTIGAGTPTPDPGGVIAPCATPTTTEPPEDGGDGGGGGGGGGGQGETPTPASPTTTPTPSPTTTTDPPNNDLDDDVPPVCPTTEPERDDDDGQDR